MFPQLASADKKVPHLFYAAEMQRPGQKDVILPGIVAIRSGLIYEVGSVLIPSNLSSSYCCSSDVSCQLAGGGGGPKEASPSVGPSRVESAFNSIEQRGPPTKLHKRLVWLRFLLNMRYQLLSVASLSRARNYCYDKLGYLA